ncbi:MAG: hypothetical protein NC409_11095 [Clostridium sp.]|nr:hypothetical protein [Clostridium sp.]
MASYNVKLYDYGDAMQIRHYGKSIVKKKRIYAEQYVMEYTDSGYVMRKKKMVDVTPVRSRDREDEEPEKNSERSEFLINRSLTNCANRAKKKIYELSRANNWEWFVTLTFNPQIVDSTDYDRVKDVVSDFFHNMRKRFAPDLKYLVVPELHADGKKYHFHGLLSNIGNLVMQDSGKTVESDGAVIYNLKQWHFGFTTATKVTDSKRVASYITKYITKELCRETDGRHRYLNSSNCNRPKVIEYEMSKEEYAEALDGLYDNIGYVKSLKIPLAHNKIEYIEINDV